MELRLLSHDAKCIFLFPCLIKRLSLSFFCSTFHKTHVPTQLFLFFVKALGHSVSRKRKAMIGKCASYGAFFFFFFPPPRQFCVLLVRTFVRAQSQQCAFSSRHKGRLFRRIREMGLFRRAGGRRQEKRNGQRWVDFAARVIERCCRCRSKKVVFFFFFAVVVVVFVVVVWLSAAGLIGRRDGIPRGNDGPSVLRRQSPRTCFSRSLSNLTSESSPDSFFLAFFYADFLLLFWGAGGVFFTTLRR